MNDTPAVPNRRRGLLIAAALLALAAATLIALSFQRPDAKQSASISPSSDSDAITTHESTANRAPEPAPTPGATETTEPPHPDTNEEAAAVAAPVAAAPAARPKARVTIQNQVLPGGQFDSRLAFKLLVANHEAILAEMEAEMAASWQTADLAELYDQQIRSQLGDGDAAAVLDHMACGSLLCLAILRVPPGGIEPAFPHDLVPHRTHTRMSMTEPGGPTIIRWLFIPPKG